MPGGLFDQIRSPAVPELSAPGFKLVLAVILVLEKTESRTVEIEEEPKKAKKKSKVAL